MTGFSAGIYTHIEVFVQSYDRENAYITLWSHYKDTEVSHVFPCDERYEKNHIVIPLNSNDKDTTYRLEASHARITFAYASTDDAQTLYKHGVAYCTIDEDGRTITRLAMDEAFTAVSNGHSHYHFEPVMHWMNDPNGLCYFQGRYHMFYQFNPYGFEWDNMHWGHAVSTDLIHWTHLPVTLFPQDFLHEWDQTRHGGAFSGSAITTDDSGRPVDGDDATVMRIYLTRHDDNHSDWRTTHEYQTTAVSTDGIHFTPETVAIEHAGEPFAPDWRDPKIDTTTGHTYIVTATNIPVSELHDDELASSITRPDDGYYTISPTSRAFDDDDNAMSPLNMDRVPAITVHRATSPSLNDTDWIYEGVLLAETEHAISKTFECPDFFMLDGHAVIMGALMHFADNSHRFQPVRWYVGDFSAQADGSNPEFTTQSSNWCDFGNSYYAVQSFLDTSSAHAGRRIAIGWIADWHHARTEGLYATNGQMSLPRQLKVVNDKLYSYPIDEVYNELVGKEIFSGNVRDHTDLRRHSQAYYAHIACDTNSHKADREDVDFLLASHSATQSELHLSITDSTIWVYTTGLKNDFRLPCENIDEVKDVEIFVDSQITEVYVNHGQSVGSFVFVADNVTSDHTIPSRETAPYGNNSMRLSIHTMKSIR